MRSAGGEALAIRHDVTSRADWEKVYAEVQATCGKLDILVNNAGIVLATPFLQQTEEDWARTYRINIDGVMFGTQYTIPLMENNDEGSIVNISSITANKTFVSIRCIRVIS